MHDKHIMWDEKKTKLSMDSNRKYSTILVNTNVIVDATIVDATIVYATIVYATIDDATNKILKKGKNPPVFEAFFRYLQTVPDMENSLRDVVSLRVVGDDRKQPLDCYQ